MFEKLESAFDLVPAEKSLPMVGTLEPSMADAELVETTLRDLIEKSTNALDEIFEIAKSSEHPRAFEVAATLVKTISDVAGKLHDINVAKIATSKANTPTAQVTNQNLFVGTTEDLMEVIKSLKNK